MAESRTWTLTGLCDAVSGWLIVTRQLPIFLALDLDLGRRRSQSLTLRYRRTASGAKTTVIPTIQANDCQIKED